MKKSRTIESFARICNERSNYRAAFVKGKSENKRPGPGLISMRRLFFHAFVESLQISDVIEIGILLGICVDVMANDVLKIPKI